MATLLVLFILATAVPAWLPTLWNRPYWPMLSKSWVFAVALGLLTVSELLQLVFVVCVCVRFDPLSHSVLFTRIGMPFCLLAILLAPMSAVRTNQ